MSPQSPPTTTTPTLYSLLSGPRHNTSSNQPKFIAWLHLGISKPNTISHHLRLLYSSGTVVRGKTQVGADLSLHHLGNPTTCIPSGELQTKMEHHHPAPTKLKLVISGHSQSLQLTDLGKSLPLICQQQPKLSYKRRVYATHMKDTPQVPSLGDRRGCATGPYRTPTTLGHTTTHGVKATLTNT